MLKAEFIYPLPSENKRTTTSPNSGVGDGSGGASGGASDELRRDGPEWLRPESTKEARVSQAALLPILVASGTQSGGRSFSVAG